MLAPPASSSRPSAHGDTHRMDAIPPLPPSVLDKVRNSKAAGDASLTDSTYYSTIQSMKFAAMSMEGLDNVSSVNNNSGKAFTPATKKAFSASLDQQVLKELTMHVDEILSLCSNPSALALAPSPKVRPNMAHHPHLPSAAAEVDEEEADFIQLPPSITPNQPTTPTPSPSSSSAYKTGATKGPVLTPALSDLSFLCMQFQVRQESLRQQYTQGHMGTPKQDEGSTSSTTSPAPPQLTLSDTLQDILNDLDNGRLQTSTNSSLPHQYRGSKTGVKPSLVPFAHLEEGHLFQVLCGMADLAFGVAVHVLRFVLRHELKTSLSQDVVFNWNPSDVPAATAALGGGGGADHQQSADLPTSRENSSACGSSVRGGSGDLSTGGSSLMGGRDLSVSSYEDLTKLSRDEDGSWRDVCATLMYHAINILGQVMLAQKSDATDRERVEASLEFLTDLSGKATHRYESEGGGVVPARTSYQHSSCLRLLHHPQLLTMRKRIQYYLLQDLGGGSNDVDGAGASSPQSSRLVEYLSVVFNGSLLPRDAELRCFAPGFKSQHMMVLANLTHNNHSASTMVATFPHASLRQGIDRQLCTPPSTQPPPPPLPSVGTTTIRMTPATPCHYPKQQQGGASGGLRSEDASPAALRPQVEEEEGDDGDDAVEGGVRVLRGMAGKHPTSTTTPSASTSSPTVGVIDILGAILGSTRLDTENPGLAEWSEFVLRGLCGVSVAARGRISGLSGSGEKKKSKQPTSAGAAASASDSTTATAPTIAEKEPAPFPPQCDADEIGNKLRRPVDGGGGPSPSSPTQHHHIQAGQATLLQEEPVSTECSEGDDDDKEVAHAADDVRVGRSESPAEKAER